MKTFKDFKNKHPELLRYLYTVIFASLIICSIALPYQKITNEQRRSESSSNQTLSHPAGIAYESKRDLLAKFIFSVAENEPYVCQVAIGAVIINRAENPDFPDDIASVIFNCEPYFDKSIVSKKPSERALNAARDALFGIDPSGGALHFIDSKSSTASTKESKYITASFGNYTFFQMITQPASSLSFRWRYLQIL